MDIEYEVRGADEAFIRVRAIPDDVDRQIRDLTKDAAEVAYAEMDLRVPESAMTGSREQPHRTVRQSLAIEEAVFTPGGLGGGGFYEATVGPIDNPPSHLEPLVAGTGRVPEVGNLLMGYPGNFFMHREATRPQNEWIDDAIDLASRHIAASIRAIRIDG